ncbi:MAG: DNA polymerase IV [Candidatus Micrarchaeota archaeon]
MFLHIDMDYFFAQIEEKRRPMAKGKIIVVCVYSGRTPDSGVVSTVNYPGREIGIRSGMPIAFAKKRAPSADTIFVPVDHGLYEEVSSGIDRTIRGIFKKVVQASIDEWNVDDGEAANKAKMLKERIMEGFNLACSVGVAPSMLGAKMAASRSKPDGLLIIDEEGEKRLIGESDVGKVPEIGPKTAEALHELGAIKVRDISRLDPMRLVEVFGRKSGAWLFDIGQGRFGGGLGEEKGQEEVSRIGTLKEMTRDPYMILAKLDELEGEAKERLLEMKKLYRTMGLIFVTEDLKTHTKSASFRNPRSFEEIIKREKEALVKEFLDENGLMVRRVGIRFSNFLELGGQTTLF